MHISELVLEMEKTALSPAVEGALRGAISGGTGGAALGAVTGKEGTRKKRALVGAGIGALALGAAQSHLQHKTDPVSHGIHKAFKSALETGAGPNEYLSARAMKHGQNILGHPAAALGTGLGGAVVGGALGAGAHKLFGGKKENRGKAGTIGAALGGLGGAAVPFALKKFIHKHGSYSTPFSISEAMEKYAYALPASLIGAGVGAIPGAIAGALTQPKGKRAKGALIGGGLGALAGGVLGHRAGTHGKDFIGASLKGKPTSMHELDFAHKMMSDPVAKASGIATRMGMGAAGGAMLGAGGHKLVGGKAENRATAGRIGALGGALGAL